MESRFISENSSQTKKMGEILAKEILKTPGGKRAFVLGLTGDLGGGKTTFLQGFAKGLGVGQRVLSPTFIILRKFSIFNFQFSNFYHIDCYRAGKAKEILNLGFKKIICDPENIIAVEWADLIKKIMPKQSLWIDFNFIDKNKRKITLKPCRGPASVRFIQ